MKISSIVAASENNAIGLKGKLLWRLPKDMQYFKDVTYGHHVLMGRKSYESIPEKQRPLAGRVNIIVTRQKDFKAEGCVVVTNVEDGIRYARENGETELMILGGGEIYNQLMKITDVIYMTRVHHTFSEADTFFPPLNEGEWRLVSSRKQAADEKHKYNFDFEVWAKNSRGY